MFLIRTLIHSITFVSKAMCDYHELSTFFFSISHYTYKLIAIFKNYVYFVGGTVT